MAESTLADAYADLVGGVGLFLGWGRGAINGDASFTTQQQNIVDYVVKSGLRQFYFPPPLDGMESVYDWSFLRPLATLSLLINTNTVALPDDYGQFEGDITILSSNVQINYPIQITNEGIIREQYEVQPTTTGRPLMAAVMPLKGTTATTGQRFQLFFFPIADATYSIQFTYYLLADYLSGSLPFAYGGAAHAETLLESCLSIAEQRIDDAASVHTAKFQERLAASVGLDRRNKPATLGYNRDNSDARHMNRRDLYQQSQIMYNGVQY